MAMDELEESKDGAAPENGPPASSAPQAEEEEDRNQRVDAAKAFFRAMYAGEETPSTFGQPQGQAQPDTSTQTACRNCEAMEFSLKEAEQKQGEAEQLYKRMAADFENYRRRMERERDESISFGVKKAAEAIMPALDDLDRAMMYLNPDTPGEKLIESFKLVSTRILQCMEAVGLKPITAIGEPFDPKFHEPVQQIETTEFADGVVMGELRKGYMLHDRCVRPALVNVASNSSGVVQPRAESAAAAAAGTAGATTAAETVAAVEPAASSEPAASAAAAQPEESSSSGAPAGVQPEEGTNVYDLGDIDV